MTEKQRQDTIVRMRELAHSLIFYGDSLHSTKRQNERSYWQQKIDSTKAEFQALIRKISPNYSSSVERFIVANRSWLSVA